MPGKWQDIDMSTVPVWGGKWPGLNSKRCTGRLDTCQSINPSCSARGLEPPTKLILSTNRWSDRFEIPAPESRISSNSVVFTQSRNSLDLLQFLKFLIGTHLLTTIGMVTNCMHQIGDNRVLGFRDWMLLSFISWRCVVFLIVLIVETWLLTTSQREGYTDDYREDISAVPIKLPVSTVQGPTGKQRPWLEVWQVALIDHLVYTFDYWLLVQWQRCCMNLLSSSCR